MLKGKVLDLLRAKSDWPAYVWERHKDVATLVAEIDACLTSVIGGQRQDGPPSQAGTSKVGGVPDVPSGFTWPTEESGDPLAFVCQINLAELPGDAELPRTGMLYLFSIADGDRAYGYEIDDSTARVIYSEDATVAPASPPAGIETIEERAVVLGAAFVPEERNDSGFPVMKRFDNSIEKALKKAIEASGGVPAGSIRMLGHAHIFREELRAAYDPEQQVLLLSVNGYNVAQEAFGEGEFHIVIDRAALRSGKLGDASVIFEPGT